MKRCIGIILLLALVFALTAYAETAWVCAVCHRQVQASLGNTCPYCGAKRHVHTWQEATCTEPKTCTACGETEGNALGHTWQEATCTEPKTCTVCGATEGALSGHQWDEGTVLYEATCQKIGVKRSACTVCGATQLEEIPVDPANHVGGTEVKGRRDATCTEDGYTGDTYCKSCGELISKGNAVPAAGHQWDEGTIIEEATCRSFGVRSFACLICGAARNEVIPKDPARQDGETEVKGKRDAACTADGYTGDTYCKGCGGLISKGSTIAAAGHRWEKGTVLSEATCQMVGAKRYMCTICGATRLEEIPEDPANHAGGTELRGVRDAACTKDGYTGDTYCKGCGGLIDKGSAIPAPGHSWQDATYTAPKTCARCGATEGEPLKKPVKVGDIITFGCYPQTASGTDSTPIEWIVLDRDGSWALLLSKYGLDAKPYNTKRVDITWEKCSLRKWLNGEFLNQAFSSEERSKIVRVKISNPDNTTYKTKDGDDTDDQIFLLSIDEAEKYFATGDARKTEPTAYARSNGVWTNDSGYCWWWLRSHGLDRFRAAYVGGDGGVYGVGDGVGDDDDAVRPALWLNLGS